MTRHATPRTRWALVIALCAAGLLEYRYGSPATLPVPTSDAVIPKAYAEMRSDPEPGAVLDLPLAVPNLERAVYVWYQTAHGRLVPWGLNDPIPEPLLREPVHSHAHSARSTPLPIVTARAAGARTWGRRTLNGDAGLSVHCAS